MKKLLFILLMFVGINSVEAGYCDYITVGNQKKLAANVAFSYDYVMGDEVTFNVTVNNLFEGLTLIDPNGKTYTNEEFVISGFKEGQTLKFEIHTSSNNCGNSLLFTKYIVLPSYNKYYSDPICKKTDFSLCKKWVKNNYQYEEFVKLVNDYNKKEKKSEEEEKKSTQENRIVAFFLEYWYIYSLLILLLIYIIYKIKEEKQIGF